MSARELAKQNVQRLEPSRPGRAARQDSDVLPASTSATRPPKQRKVAFTNTDLRNAQPQQDRQQGQQQRSQQTAQQVDDCWAWHADERPDDAHEPEGEWDH
jgi:hypothetical protein